MTLPPSLERFQHDLESAVGRDVASRRRTVRRRRRVAGAGAALAAAAAVAFGLVGLTWDDGGPSTSGVSPAQAVERARAALAAADGQIVHVRMEGFQDNGDGTTATWVNELWRQMGTGDSRSLEIGFDGVRAETDQRGGESRVYDASTNTIYVAPAGSTGDAAGEPEPLRIGQVLATLDDGTRVVVGLNGDKLKLAPGDPLPEGSGKVLKSERDPEAEARQAEAAANEDEDPWRSQLQALLDETDAREDGRVQVHGQEAVRYVSADGSQAYYFAPETGNPIEFTTQGTTGGTRLTFTVYEKLDATDESLALLDLAEQHPDAEIVRDAEQYEAAMGRLFAHG
jgi:hypothetical protein